MAKLRTIKVSDEEWERIRKAQDAMRLYGYEELQKAFPGLKVTLEELGWPSLGQTVGIGSELLVRWLENNHPLGPGYIKPPEIDGPP